MSFIFDYKRPERIGLPESILCESKPDDLLETLLEELSVKKDHPVLLTRLSQKKFKRFKKSLNQKINYHSLSETGFLNGTFPKLTGVSVAILAAGTSDLKVAWEVSRTLEYLGIANHIYSDIGVAGLWRLERHMKDINKADILIVIAGMDAALASVVGGLTPKPLIAVPTSVGYGVAQGGETALRSMLASCAPGIVVTNIDNGYGAACAAFRILKNFRPK